MSHNPHCSSPASSAKARCQGLLHNHASAALVSVQAWQELEGLVDAGLTKAIGVSNFRVSDLQDILSNARIKVRVLLLQLVQKLVHVLT